MLSLLMRHARSLTGWEFHLNFLFLVFCFAGKKDDGEACVQSLFHASFMQEGWWKRLRGMHAKPFLCKFHGKKSLRGVRVMYLVHRPMSSWWLWANEPFSWQKHLQNCFKRCKCSNHFTCADGGVWPHISDAPHALGSKESVWFLYRTFHVDHGIPSETTKTATPRSD